MAAAAATPAAMAAATAAAPTVAVVARNAAGAVAEAAAEQPTTNGQIVLLLIFVGIAAAWVLVETLPLWHGLMPLSLARYVHLETTLPTAVARPPALAEVPLKPLTPAPEGGSSSGAAEPLAAATGSDVAAAAHQRSHAAGGETAIAMSDTPPPNVKVAVSASAPPSTAAAPAAEPPLAWWRTTLRAAVIFGAIVLLMYLVDGPPALGHHSPHKRVYDRDLFIFIVLTLLLIAVLTGRTIGAVKGRALAPNAAVKSHIFNREQSEEWKGLMQTGFVLYHYFNAQELYNVIRLFIAAYVWMTGFGNFSFFWTRKDYSVVRTVKMLIRLNLLVAFVAIALNKEYMLYYVCPLHTTFFLLTYATMGIGHSRNGNPGWIPFKLGVVFVVLFLVFDVPGVFEIVWSPLYWLMSYRDSLHEWQFRSTLDHYATWIGMVCAYGLPHFERWLLGVEAHPSARHRALAKGCLAGASLLGIGTWVYCYFTMPKFDYNQHHPYVSWAPILGYLFLRNLTPFLRQRVRRPRARFSRRRRRSCSANTRPRLDVGMLGDRSTPRRSSGPAASRWRRTSCSSTCGLSTTRNSGSSTSPTTRS